MAKFIYVGPSELPVTYHGGTFVPGEETEITDEKLIQRCTGHPLFKEVGGAAPKKKAAPKKRGPKKKPEPKELPEELEDEANDNGEN